MQAKPASCERSCQALRWPGGGASTACRTLRQARLQASPSRRDGEMLGYFWMVRGRNPGIRGRLRVHSWRGVGGHWGGAWKWVRKDITAVLWDWKGILGKRHL